MEALGLVWNAPWVLTLSVSNWINFRAPQILLPSFSSLPSVETNGSFQLQTLADAASPLPIGDWRRSRPQNSRFFLTPGSGTGYLPLASASSGAGESIVSLSS